VFKVHLMPRMCVIVGRIALKSGRTYQELGITNLGPSRQSSDLNTQNIGRIAPQMQQRGET
jgi:hypothetical protein